MEKRFKEREEQAIARHEEVIARHEAAIRQQRALDGARSRYQVARNNFEANPTIKAAIETIIAEDDFLQLSTERHNRTICEPPKLFEDLLRTVRVATKPKLLSTKGVFTKYPNRSSMKKSVQNAARLIATSKHELEELEGSRANLKRILQHAVVVSHPNLVREIRETENYLKGKTESFFSRPDITNALRVLSEARDRETNLIKTHAWYFRLARKSFFASMLTGIAFVFDFFLMFLANGELHEPIDYQIHDLNERLNPQLTVVLVIFIGLTHGISKILPRFVSFLPPRE